jgi:hypothetical protein
VRVVAAGLLAAALLVATAASGARSATRGIGATMAAGGCTLRAVKPLPPRSDPPNYHADVPTLDAPVRWATDPPSAGSHYGAWAVWGFYSQPANPRQVVHNEEHGGVIIWWGPKVPAKTVARLRAFYAASPYGMLGTPYPKLGARIALTAWTGNPQTYFRNGRYGVGRIALCSRFDRTAFTAFRHAYRAKGPEGFPLAADKPGTGPQ